MGDLASNLGLYIVPLVGSTLLAFGLYQLVNDLRRSDKKRVADRLTEGGGRGDRKLPSSILRRKMEPQTAISGLLSRLSIVTWLQKALDQACIEWTATTLLLNLLGMALFAGIGLHFMGHGILLGVGISTAILTLPLLVIHIKRKKRLARMMYQLPDVFDLMGQALRAGHSLSNAMHLISVQLPDPAGTEFAIVFHEQNLGLKIEDSLKSMAERLDLMDVRFFVTAVLIQRTTGGDLAEVLDNIGTVIRDRIKLFGQVKALTAEGRLSGWVLFALPFIMFAAENVLNPDYAGVLISEPIGRYFLIGAVVAQLLGLAMIQKIVNIKV